MSIVHVVHGSSSSSGGGGKVAAERILFVGHKIPEEIKTMITLITDLDKTTFRQILTLTVSALEGDEVNMTELFESIHHHLPTESASFIISGLYRLLQLALRSSIKSEVFSEDLKDMKIPSQFIPDLVNAVFGQRRPFLLKHGSSNGVKFTKLESLKWRVDVGVSTSVLNRLLEPSVTMEMTLSNGKIQQFEVPIHKFHELRYNIAHVLKEMEVLENRSILKIQD